MSYNLSWGILALGVPVTTPEYGRRFSETAYKGSCRDLLSVLVPVPEGDPMKRAFHIEELIKLIRRSTLKSRFDSFDSFNTYDQAELQFPAPGFDSDSPVDLNPKIIGTVPVSRLRISASYNAATMTYKDSSDNRLLAIGPDSYDVTYTNGQSDDVTVVDNTFFLRLKESEVDAQAQPFDIGFEYISELHISWEGLLASLEQTSYTFKDVELKTVWNEETSFVERIAAFAMDVLETCGG